MQRIRPFLLLLIFGMLAFGACKMALRSVRYNKPGLEDFKYWEESPIQRSGEVHAFVDGTQKGLPPLADWAQGKDYQEGMEEGEFFQKTGTAAFVVLRGDTLLYEYYDTDFSPESRFNSFSMSKPYVATCLGIALAEGHIDSLDQSVGDFLPRFADSALCKIKIRHLIQMTSGLKTTEGYLNLWSTTAKLYYGDKPKEVVEKSTLAEPPGTKWKYQNLNIQILGMVLRKATGMPVSKYLQEKIWGPMGMEADAGWSLHEDGETEKSFCCLNARARDYARFGLLLAQNGNWKGQQLIPEEWISRSTGIDTTEASRQRYQHTFYTSVEQEDFYLQGLLGQYTYVAPSNKTIVVRIGRKINPSTPWYDMFKYLAKLTKKPKAVEIAPSTLTALEGTWTFGLSNFSDSLMWGKQAHFSATPKGMRVKADFNKTWIASPSSDSTFFNLKYARRLLVRFDEKGIPNQMRWERRGNAWWLHRAGKESDTP